MMELEFTMYWSMLYLLLCIKLCNLSGQKRKWHHANVEVMDKSAIIWSLHLLYLSVWLGVWRSSILSQIDGSTILITDRVECPTNNQWEISAHFKYGPLVWSELQHSGDEPHRLGTPHREPKRAQWKQELKYCIIHRQQTYLYLGLPYTENTKQST